MFASQSSHILSTLSQILLLACSTLSSNLFLAFFQFLYDKSDLYPYVVVVLSLQNLIQEVKACAYSLNGTFIGWGIRIKSL